MSRRGALRAFVLMAVIAIAVIAVAPTVKRFVRDLSLPLEYRSLIREQAREKHLSAALIAAVIYTETRFDPRTSPAGALGLMQIEPATAEFLAQRSGGVSFTISDLSRPDVNIAYGAYYLRYLLNRYGHDETLALAAYNGGETNVDSWLAQAHAANVRFTVDEIPFPETRAYVKRVERTQREYARKYGL
jgi:soluble lytic murein transglycosylase